MKEEGVYHLDFDSQENRFLAHIIGSDKDARIFIEGKNIHDERAIELFNSKEGKYRAMAKTINHGLNYDMGKLLLAHQLGVSLNESNQLVHEFLAKNPELRKFRGMIKQENSIMSLLYERVINLRGHMKVNWIVQGSCAELLWEALRYLATIKDRVKILPHFHDELVLKCLICQAHSDEVCLPMMKVKDELEALFPFYWVNSKVKVFKLGIKKK